MVRHKSDWHPADIRAAVAKAGYSLSALSLVAGLPEWSCRSALRAAGNLRGEQVIAELLGTTPETIWPSRFSKPRKYRRLQVRPLSVSRLRQNDKAA